MKAKVMSILSGSDYADGERRVEIVIDGADAIFRRIRVPEKMIGIKGIELDMELVMDFLPAAHPVAAEGVGAVGRGKK